MSFVRKGGIANDIVLQGYQSRNLTVLIDGERIYGLPERDGPAVFHADFAEVDHLEIAKGPFDVRHQGSLGGLVNVVTRAPGPGFHASPSFSAGSGLRQPIGRGFVGHPGRRCSAATRTARPPAPRRFRRAVHPVRELPAGRDGLPAFEIETGWGRLYVSPRPDTPRRWVHAATGGPRALSLPPDGRAHRQRRPAEPELRRGPGRRSGQVRLRARELFGRQTLDDRCVARPRPAPPIQHGHRGEHRDVRGERRGGVRSRHRGG